MPVVPSRTTDDFSWYVVRVTRPEKANKQIRFKKAMLRSSLCDSSDAYILVKGNITVNNTAAAGAAATNTNKKVIFKNCPPLTTLLTA